MLVVYTEEKRNEDLDVYITQYDNMSCAKAYLQMLTDNNVDWRLFKTFPDGKMELIDHYNAKQQKFAEE